MYNVHVTMCIRKDTYLHIKRMIHVCIFLLLKGEWLGCVEHIIFSIFFSFTEMLIFIVCTHTMYVYYY